MGKKPFPQKPTPRKNRREIAMPKDERKKAYDAGFYYSRNQFATKGELRLIEKQFMKESHPEYQQMHYEKFCQGYITFCSPRTKGAIPSIPKYIDIYQSIKPANTQPLDAPYRIFIEVKREQNNTQATNHGFFLLHDVAQKHIASMHANANGTAVPIIEKAKKYTPE